MKMGQPNAKSDSRVNRPLRVAQKSVTKIISPTIMNLITPKVGAKHDLLFNEPVSAY
jgi:hypothetical protein